MPDLYRVLGVQRDATLEIIKKSYKRLIRKYHPDINKSADAVERFQEIKKAYEILANAEDRKMYDHYGDMMFKEDFRGETSESTWAESGAGSFESFFQGFTGEDPSTYENSSYSWEPRTTRNSNFSSNDFGFGGNRQSRSDFQPPERGVDIHVTLSIKTLEAIQGCQKKIQLRRPSRWKRNQQQSMNSEIVQVQVPPNTLGGAEIRIEGKGNFGKGGGADGNLVVRIEVQPSSQLFREGANLLLLVPITLQEALYGSQIEVPTLGKSLKIRVPKGVKMGQKLRIKSKGAPLEGGGFGDLYLILYPVAPISDDPKLRELAEALEAFYPSAGVRNSLAFK